MLGLLKKKILNSVAAGICASASSLFGKLSGIDVYYFNVPVFLFKSVFFTLMLICNAAVWTFFVKALQDSTSSLPATVTSAATNYFCSAVMGFILFGEVTSLLWWSGTLLVLMGLVLICKSQCETELRTKIS